MLEYVRWVDHRHFSLNALSRISIGKFLNIRLAMKCQCKNCYIWRENSIVISSFVFVLMIRTCIATSYTAQPVVSTENEYDIRPLYENFDKSQNHHSFIAGDWAYYLHWKCLPSIIFFIEENLGSISGKTNIRGYLCVADNDTCMGAQRGIQRSHAQSREQTLDVWKWNCLDSQYKHLEYWKRKRNKSKPI